MNLAVLHYHLNRGGVTRVIENHLLALDAVLPPSRPSKVLLLYGGRREGFDETLAGRLGSIRLSLGEVAALDYDSLGNVSAGDPDRLADEIVAALARAGMKPDDTVVHVHNHAIGKNMALPAALGRLAERGWRLLLQIHDFAEDLRPENFRLFFPARAEGLAGGDGHGRLYPQGAGVYYAVLNGRDYAVLQRAGVSRERLHFLPNPVLGQSEPPQPAEARAKLERCFGIGPHDRYLLYPVRGIRRKNLGETLLHSALAPRGTTVGITLAPLNPAEHDIYNHWKQVAGQLELPCRFEVGAEDGLRFDENLAAADQILTTSVAEGFGMVFLEAWLAGRVLLGRDLPEITADFVEAGVRLELLAPRLGVPVDWISISDFRQRLIDAFRRTMACYGHAEPLDLTKGWDAKIIDGLVDFGDLDEALQEDVLRRVQGDAGARDALLDCNPWLGPALSISDCQADELIAHNAKVIRREFSPVPSGQRLLEIYDRVASSRTEKTTPLDRPEAILDAFLDPGRFRLIRS